MIKRTVLALGLFLPVVMTSAALADEPVCNTCTANNQYFVYDADASSTDTIIVTTDDFFNQALLASDGRASENNRSDFNNQTTTVTEVSTDIFRAYSVNNGNRTPGQDVTQESTTIVSSETVKIKVK